MSVTLSGPPRMKSGLPSTKVEIYGLAYYPHDLQTLPDWAKAIVAANIPVDVAPDDLPVQPPLTAGGVG